MKREDLEKLARFFNDPEWQYVEDMLKEYIEPLKSISSIDLKQDSQAVHAELKANRMAVEAIEKFLMDTNIIKRATNTKEVSFK